MDDLLNDLGVSSVVVEKPTSQPIVSIVHLGRPKGSKDKVPRLPYGKRTKKEKVVGVDGSCAAIVEKV